MARASFDPPLPYSEISRVYDFTTWLLEKMGMPQWRIQVTEAPAPRNAYACIAPAEGKHVGELSLGPAWMSYDLEAERIPTLIHEIVHLTHRGLTDIITDDMHRWVGSFAYGEMHRVWTREIELWVDHMSQVLLGLLRPDWEIKAAEIWGDDWREHGSTTGAG